MLKVMVQIIFWKTLQEFRLFCSTDMKWDPLRTDLIFGKRKNLQGARTDE
jgi:hypothetical protein